MAWHAVRAAGESVSATRTLLSNASLLAWLRLSVLVLFVGTLVTPFLVDFNRGTTLLGSVPEPTTPAVVGAALVASLVLCVGAVFEFVFLDVLRGEPVGLVSGSERRFHPGMQLFALRVALVAIGGLSIGALVLADGSTVLVATVGSLVVALLLFDRLTVAFVVPIVIVEGCSLPAGWRAFAGALRSEWREYVVCLLIAGVLWGAVAIGGGLLAALLASVLLVPFGTIGIGVSGALLARGLSEGVVASAVGGTLAVPYVLSFLLVILLVHVPLVAYLRYVELLVLGDTTERYDPIPRLRATIRRN